MPVLLMVLDQAYTIGSAELPAPQAGLMALMGKGIVGGEMAWPLVIVGMFLGVALILIKAPSPMLIAVGMYLPFPTTSAVFVGGSSARSWTGSWRAGMPADEEKMKAENSGVLVASGLIAGQSLMAVLLAFIVLYEQAKLGMAETEHLLPTLGQQFRRRPSGLSAALGSAGVAADPPIALVSQPGEGEILSCVPHRLGPWQADGDVRVVVERPRPATRGLRGAFDHLRWLMSHPKIRLDDLGSFVWKRMEGGETLAEIAAPPPRPFPTAPKGWSSASPSSPPRSTTRGSSNYAT